VKARCSALPVLQYCGKATAHDIGSGRAAAMGTAFHARCCKAPDASALFDLLSTAEQLELDEWKKPEPIVLDGFECRYEGAMVEVALGGDINGECCDIDAPQCVLTGHADMYWVHGDTLLLGDIKKTKWTTTDGPESLQLHAYAQLLAAKHGCTRYRCGLWIADEGFWIWGDVIECTSIRALKVWAVIQAILDRETVEYATGPHCRNCYGRTRCPAYMVEGKVPGTDIAPEDMTNGHALELLSAAKRLEDLAEGMSEFARAWALRNGGVKDGNKVYRPVRTQGRESADLKAIKADGLTQYVKRGAEFEQWRWLKA
jgi:hypothetical protein